MDGYKPQSNKFYMTIKKNYFANLQFLHEYTIYWFDTTKDSKATYYLNEEDLYPLNSGAGRYLKKFNWENKGINITVWNLSILVMLTTQFWQAKTWRATNNVTRTSERTCQGRSKNKLEQNKGNAQRRNIINNREIKIVKVYI